MNTGYTLSEFAREVQRQAAAKRDFRTPVKALDVTEHGKITIANEGFGIKQTGHEHLSLLTEIPRAYYNRMLADAPVLWADNVNHWIHGSDEQKLVRTIDGGMRAVLSPKYRVIDYVDTTEAILPVLLEEFKDVDVQAAQLTDRRMYLKATRRALTHEPRVGDIVNGGVTISNSEIGAGYWKVEPFIYRLICKNGMTVPDAALRKMHVGRHAGLVEEAVEVFSEETVREDLRVLMMKMKDVVRAALDEVRFREIAGRLTEGTDRLLPRLEAPAIVKEVTRKYALGDAAGEGILARLAAGADYTQYGLANAITNLANDPGMDADTATEFERAGGAIAMLPDEEWLKIAA